MEERQAALEYAQSIVTSGANITELMDGENDNDEMFWMMLGSDEFAKAGYWQWRRDSTDVDPRIWRVNAEKPKKAVSPQTRFKIIVLHIFAEGRPCAFICERNQHPGVCVHHRLCMGILRPSR